MLCSELYFPESVIRIFWPDQKASSGKITNDSIEEQELFSDQVDPGGDKKHRKAFAASNNERDTQCHDVSRAPIPGAFRAY